MRFERFNKEENVWDMADREDILANFQVNKKTSRHKEKEWQSK